MNPKTVMSIIIDGMDQGHCKVPYLGSADTFGDPLHQSIIGVKEHGQGFTIFRTVDTISKSADVSSGNFNNSRYKSENSSRKARKK
jgi:hypothetical protein